MSIASNLTEIRSTIPDHVKLIAVSKFHPCEAILEAYNAGQRIFGESRQQEVEQKQNLLPSDIQWHFIGHLQTNKVKAILPYTHTIHSVDSWKLISEIEKNAAKIGKTINCLLEIHIADEESKLGFDFDECEKMLDQNNWQSLKYARIAGVMGMATYTDDEKKVREEFKALRSFFDCLKQDYFKDFDYFSEISMGMSHDYRIAIEEGSTMVRIGTSIFGEREY
ncbi:YggS family pyridoxal phosphate-dependent enzyme [Dysgonomonas sp. 520]|uniref:YggS family pyridoxal phosphate-dependent enzyme n=1 Tax=Dysgonomonas sp. 520 TaxID=2302931 RepID=UPI0013D86771|nr:YggS family pyridoxal phosphate-dependent enzyme [Dysgonomonas sp. 520]NDW08083.1 YggS family pyridoxal phosphate-dependent enzyme [Dysgonomonas sp. 520]